MDPRKGRGEASPSCTQNRFSLQKREIGCPRIYRVSRNCPGIIGAGVLLREITNGDAGMKARGWPFSRESRERRDPSGQRFPRSFSPTLVSTLSWFLFTFTGVAAYRSGRYLHFALNLECGEEKRRISLQIFDLFLPVGPRNGGLRCHRGGATLYSHGYRLGLELLALAAVPLKGPFDVVGTT